MGDIASFLRDINAIASREKEISNAKGENFNVFKLCGVYHYENSHSDIIAEFLDPKGSHGCGNDFLLAFCRIVGLDANQYGNADVDVTREQKILDGSGRVDIIFEAGINKTIIENKIYANEGDGQLRKYRNWLDDNSGKGAPLFFLTLDGRESNDQDMKGLYKPISYKFHIIAWLNECIRIAVEKPFVRESLIQYKNLVEDLTKGNTMTQEEEKRIQCIQNNFQAAIAVADSLIQAKAQWFYKNIVEPLLDAGITVDVERGQWQQLIRSSQGKRNCYLDCFIAYRKGATKVVYAYSHDFQDPRREITTFSTPESDEIISFVKEPGKMPHAIPDDLWGNSEKAACIVKNIREDIKKHFEAS